MELGAFSISLAVEDLRYVRQEHPHVQPGWDAHGNPVESFTDVREIQRQVKASGLSLSSEADEATEGPASFIAIDPDGNPILVDQHV